MENNIFIKLKKNKFNPDIEDKLKNKQNERDCTTFSLHTSIYNPITGVIPQKIESNKDLVLSKDESFDKNIIQKLVAEKNNERKNQDLTFQPVKTKVINNNPPPVKEVIKAQPVNRTNYIETFEDMRRGSHMVKKNDMDNKSNKYDDILVGLKDLGIIK